MTVDIMGKFTAVGMRVGLPPGAIVINTCSGNDTSDAGGDFDWAWSNPTNRMFRASFEGANAASTECLWQGLKSIKGRPCPDPMTLAGDWRRGKAKRPAGHWGGAYAAFLIADPGAARRRIYIPAFRSQIERWLESSVAVLDRVERARRDRRQVFLRDWDTGRGVDNRGPMSHAWVLAEWLNTGRWPG